MNFYFRLLLCLLLLTVAAREGFAEVRGSTIEKEGRTLLVLENDAARVEVWPEAGAAVTSYVDKRSGVEFVAGEAKLKGAYHAWKDVTRLNYADGPDQWMGAQPYRAELRDGAIVVVGDHGHLREEREMRLADSGTKLTIVTRHTNISDQPRTIFSRWHPYMEIGDTYAENSVILAPGPAPLTVRRITVGQGFEAHFMEVPGYWMAIDAKTGVGMWMTFAPGSGKPEDLMCGATWTDYNFTQHPRRGWFVAEIYPRPRIVAPGGTLEMHFVYQPFAGDDATEDLTVDLVDAASHAAAKRFASLARGNAPLLREHSMQPTSSGGGVAVEQENRFNFAHKRRDRFALLDWGVVDAMMAVPGDQEAKPIRTRLFAQAFEAASSAHPVVFRLTVTDGAGREVRREQWDYTLAPAGAMKVDERQDVSLAGLPDGRYLVALAAYADGGSEPVHVYERPVKLSAQAKAAAQESRRQRDAAPFLERERPFVKALREMTLEGGVAPIGVEEASGIARQGWPVRAGVPFAQGVLARGAQVKLVSPSGAAVPAQTQMMGTWPDGSVRWLLVDFAADVPANGHVFYTLSQGAPEAAAGAAIATQEGSAITVDTGVRQWRFEGNLIDGDLWWETGTTSGDPGQRYTFKLEGEGAGMTIETNGPQRAVVKATGWYFSEGVATPIARGELRAEFYRGQKHYKLEHTYTYAGDPWRDTLVSTGIAFRFPERKFDRAVIELDGEAVTETGALTLRQTTESTAAVGDREGRRASGAAALVSAAGNAAVYHRGLWKMFPKRLEAIPAAGALAFHYWPADAEPLDWRPNEDIWNPSSGSPEALAAGVSRTHEFIIDDQGSIELAQMERLFDEPVIALTVPKYLCQTNAIHGLSPYDPVNSPELENAISEVIESYELHREVYGWYGQWFYGSMPNTFDALRLRWADYGRYGNILNEQDIVHGPWLAYLRGGDRKHLRFAEANTRHLMDVASIRLSPTWPDMVGLSRRHHETVWLGPGDYGHSMLDPYLEMYHATGHQPAMEAAQRLAQAMSHQRSGSWRYISNPLAGLARMYLETGESFYKEHADRIWAELCYPEKNQWWVADHGGRASIYYSQINPQCAELFRDFAESKPGAFDTLDALGELYRQTGDVKHLQKARKAFEEQLKGVQGYDPGREDPMFWSAAFPVQHVMASLRQWVYASQLLTASAEPRP